MTVTTSSRLATAPRWLLASLSLLLTAACQTAAPKPRTSPPPQDAVDVSEPSAPRTLVLTDASVRCESEAIPVSLEVKDAPVSEFLTLFGQLGGLPVRSELDVSETLVTLSVESVPWDCVLLAVAKELGMEVDPQPEEIVLRVVD